MQGRILGVLMWKHLMVRKRRFLHTAVELLSPVLFILLLFVFRNYLRPMRPSASHEDENMVRMTDVKDLLDRSHVPVPRFLLYTPSTPRADALMDEIGKNLDLSRADRLPDRLLNYKGYLSYTNLSDIADFVKDLHTNEAIIIFEDMDGEDWSDKLKYTVRWRSAFHTNTYMSFSDVPQNNPKFGFDYEEFMRLQWAIDTSYIKVRTGQDVTQKLLVQEFPYYGSERSSAVKIICSLLPVIQCISLFILFVFLMSRLLEERTTGIQELIKMVGVSVNTLGISHFLNVLPTGLIYAIFITSMTVAGDNPLIYNSNGVIIFIMAALHFVTVAAMAFACSYLAKSTQYTVSISIFAYIVMWTPAIIIQSRSLPRVGVLFSGILPHVPVYWLWEEISTFEQYDYGLAFVNITQSHSSTSGPVLLGFGWLVVQCAIFFGIAWYLSHVCPGKHGQALPWNFFCQKQYWTQNEVKPESDTDEEEPIARDRRYFEEAPKNMEIGIKIENVSKFFPKHKALSNVSLEVYKGEITVLLGHNGAGKTTLMSIITGMMSATEGEVYVNGMDTEKQRDLVRTQLGLCPQHNLFFPDLTVLEHAIFFTLLKGGSFREAHDTSMALLNRLGISDKAHNKSAELSGGMKRRLQLACALAGGASVLVLDEPTSGLDVETRRKLWDLLLSLRGERTVLLTTHFMEEADALGDRVAALHLGHLRCHATTMHLKRAVGTGYRLSFTTNGPPRDSAITSVVTSFVPDAALKEKTLNSLSYNLPAAGSANFPNLFTSLEEKKSELGIETIGVGVSTLEEVFLKLCSDTDTTFCEDEVDTGRVEPTYNKVTGCPLYLRQFCVLFKRQFKYVMSKKMSFCILQAFLPILMIFVFTGISNNYEMNDTSQPKIALDLDLYVPLSERKALYNVNATGVSVRSLAEKYPKVTFKEAKNITDAILSTAKISILDYNKYLVGIELTDTEAKAWYTTVYRHAAPVAVNLLTNAIAMQSVPAPASGGRVITTYLHPIEVNFRADDPLLEAKNAEMCVIWAVFIVFIILSTNLNFASLPCRERTSGSRHIHIMAGCPSALHWAVTLVFHITTCIVTLVVATCVAAAVIDTDSTLNQPQMILTVMLTLTIGSLAFFAFMYWVTFYFTERMTSIILVALMVIFGLITPGIMTTIEILSSPEETNIFTKMFLQFAAYTMPPHAMTVAAAKCAYVARLNAMCSLNRHRCPSLFVQDSGFDTEKCCAGEDPRSYFANDKFSPALELTILVAQFVVYMTIVTLTQQGRFDTISDRIFNMRFRNRATVQSRDEIVRAEAVYVNKEIALPKKQIEDAKVTMLVNDVHKNYHRFIGKSCYAVQGVSFSVKQGECFGLLGVNGAGKSTTFKMLTAEVCATKGDIYANGHYINKDKTQYLRSLGYCPQFFGLDEFQTGRDNLELLLTLRGLDARDVSAEVKSWIDVVGLEKYSRRVVSGYSGGCARRLGTAAALCSGAPLTLLDEPTAGVDVAARRRVWRALRRSMAARRPLVITSHSMDEMEALCTRIGIMSGGVLCALGTPHELRARHAQGHAVVIKVAHAIQGDEVDSAKSEIASLKSSLHSKFNCTLKDEHKTMLHYHINETMRYSDLFSELEKLKSTYPQLVEDYSVTETTLEEVFLSFAKEHTEDSPQPDRQNGIV